MPTSLVFLTTTGSGTWTVPASWTSMVAESISGGGGAGKGSSLCTGAGGGGYQKSGSVSVTPGDVHAFSVGAGGVGSATATGGDGGDTWFANNNTATSITSAGVISGARGGKGSQPVTGSGGSFTAAGGSGISVYGVGTFATWNPSAAGGTPTFTASNLAIQGATGTTTWYTTRATQGFTDGKFYYEATITANGTGGGSNGDFAIGWENGSANLVTTPGNQPAAAFYFPQTGLTFIDGGTGSIQTGSVGNVIGVAIDLVNSKIWWRTNTGNWNNSGTANPATNVGGLSFTFTGRMYPSFGYENTDSKVTANFGATSFTNTAPSGFNSVSQSSSMIQYNGGDGTGSVNTFGSVHQSSGGGGAAGPLGNGGVTINDNTLSGSGGGGNGGGSAGHDATGSSGTTGGLGGDNNGGTGHGVTGTSNGAGTNGGGGAGGQTGINGSGGVNHSGGDGGNGTEWDATHGSGGGGGEGDNTSSAHTGGAGGLYGGGAGNGGGSASSTGANGGQGIIVITGTYTSGGGGGSPDMFFSS